MKNMNVTARHGQGAVHLGGHEMVDGRWSPVCGTQHHNGGGREVAPLRPTKDAVTCKRCLKVIAKDAGNTQTAGASAPQPKQAKPEPTATRKARTFTFEYNASEGVMIAAVLREKALVERKVAQGYRTNAAIEGTTLVEFYTEQARLADNRAKLYEDAAEKMHKPVREAISTAVMNALPDEPESTLHRQMKDAIDLRW